MLRVEIALAETICVERVVEVTSGAMITELCNCIEETIKLERVDEDVEASA